MTSVPEPDVPEPPPEASPASDGGEVPSPDVDEEQLSSVWSEADDALVDVASLVAQRDEYLGALQRTQADFANYRKRVLRLQEEHAARAAVDLVGKLLPVLDALDLAVQHIDTLDDTVQASTEAQALRQARSLLADVLAKEGLVRIDEAGGRFDPSVHDAVAHAPASEEDVADGSTGSTIDEVLRSGYSWRGQTLRPAMVRVRG